MYLQFFGLAEPPFSITPDPAFVYLSAAHREALAHLLFGVGQGAAGGFVQLTGEVGTGKTTLCRCMLQQLPDHTRVALILNPLVTPHELVATICDELNVAVDGPRDSAKALVDSLNRYLLERHAAGDRVVVIIDEAQNLSPEALEQVRLLTNLETAKHKLLQMVLLGQPELRPLLQRQNLRQLAQRITARYHLMPLAEDETAAYVRHRMRVAGAARNPFKPAALRALHQRSGGVPRLINIIADRALAGAYAREAGQVTAKLVHAAADEVQPSEARVSRRVWPAWLAAGSVLVLLTITFLQWGLPWLEIRATPSVNNVSTRETRVPAAAQDAVTVVPPVVDEPAAAPVVDERAAAPAVDETAAAPAVAPELPESSSEEAGREGVAPGPVVTVQPTPVEITPEWLDRQHDRAFAGMAELWHDAGSADAIRAACAGELRRGYACLRDSGSWARVVQLGLPVILVLQDHGTHHVLLRGVDAGRVLLGASDDALEFDRDHVDPLWLGEFLVAWPQAPDWPIEIRRGETGAAVEIVLQMAALAEPPWQGGKGFDEQFEAWLLEFQRRNGLTPDGIIGPKTLLYLMAPGFSEPRLVTSLEPRP